MYLIELGFWAIQNEAESREQLVANMSRELAKERAEKENGTSKLPGIRDRVSEPPNADDSLYAFNDTYIELYAGALQERRGAITVMTLLLAFIVWTLGSLSIKLGTVWFTHVQYGIKRPAITMDYVAPILVTLIVLGICLAIYKFLWRFIRLENFVQRIGLYTISGVTAGT